jgi:hypothetical protein
MGKYWHPTEYGTPMDVYTFHQLSNEGYIVKDIPDTQLMTMEMAERAVARLNL